MGGVVAKGEEREESSWGESWTGGRGTRGEFLGGVVGPWGEEREESSWGVSWTGGRGTRGEFLGGVVVKRELMRSRSEEGVRA